MQHALTRLETAEGQYAPCRCGDVPRQVPHDAAKTSYLPGFAVNNTSGLGHLADSPGNDGRVGVPLTNGAPHDIWWQKPDVDPRHREAERTKEVPQTHKLPFILAAVLP